MTYIQYKYDDLITHLVQLYVVPGGSGILAFILVLLLQGWDVLKIPSKLKHDSKKKKEVERKKKGENWRKKKEQEANLYCMYVIPNTVCHTPCTTWYRVVSNIFMRDDKLTDVDTELVNVDVPICIYVYCIFVYEYM